MKCPDCNAKCERTRDYDSETNQYMYVLRCSECSYGDDIWISAQVDNTTDVNAIFKDRYQLRIARQAQRFNQPISTVCKDALQLSRETEFNNWFDGWDT